MKYPNDTRITETIKFVTTEYNPRNKYIKISLLGIFIFLKTNSNIPVSMPTWSPETTNKWLIPTLWILLDSSSSIPLFTPITKALIMSEYLKWLS